MTATFTARTFVFYAFSSGRNKIKGFSIVTSSCTGIYQIAGFTITTQSTVAGHRRRASCRIVLIVAPSRSMSLVPSTGLTPVIIRINSGKANFQISHYRTRFASSSVNDLDAARKRGWIVLRTTGLFSTTSVRGTSVSRCGRACW